MQPQELQVNTSQVAEDGLSFNEKQTRTEMHEESSSHIHGVEGGDSKLTLSCADAKDRGLPQFTNYDVNPDRSMSARSSVKVPSTAHLSPEEQKIVQELDADGDGVINGSDLIAGAKRHAEAQKSIVSLRRRMLLITAWSLAGIVLFFGLSVLANWQSKMLFLDTGDTALDKSPLLVSSTSDLVTVASAKVSVPLYLAPFFSDEQLRDVEEVRYYDCEGEEEVWGNVISIRRYAPGVFDDVNSTGENVGYDLSAESNFSLTLVLATGRELMVDTSGGYLVLPGHEVPQELCGELRCAQMRLFKADLQELEEKAALALGEESNRRLQRRPNNCRRCAGGSRRRRRPQRPRPVPSPAPPARPAPPAPVPAPEPPVPLTPIGQATRSAALQVHQLIEASGSQADAIGGIVRLAFHDAGSFDGNSGGADGCIDLLASGNRGLGPVIDSLAPVVDSAAGLLSRADVWALAANVAIELADGPQLDFQAGRADSASCQDDGHGKRHPDAELGHAHIRKQFVDTLGFTERETAALIGAHVLGRAETSNSGYNGAWVPRNDRFTNDFFRDLLRRPWDKQMLPDFEGLGRTQWDGPRDTMMLNTDIELAFDTSSGCTRAGGRPQQNSCPRATHGFSAAVTEFGQGNLRSGQQAFHAAFAPAFKKLMALGSREDSLSCALADCSTPGPF
eukprot:TRINITY_DN91251_c0_g1_i1.p1 TRINITY_DN91251_c0_g1~~TRINITY_DN91251_c0_g1_i1.p1  ORF type:complete len:711 (-),score=119.42 TRINITY_DN91251_c0_g1_i1:231-2264(-)